MANHTNHPSGKLFFFLIIASIFVGILATALLANRHRNLARLLTYFGYTDFLSVEKRAGKTVFITTRKGGRLPAARMFLPTYALVDLKVPEQRFRRVIQSDPKTLCEKVKEGGFGNLDWTENIVTKKNWECLSFTEVRARAGSKKKSSVFISINGNAENRVTSFRVKLNIEDLDDTIQVTDLAGNAANIFLRQVRWENPGEILGKIHGLEVFDIHAFGSRIQFKREFGDTPRYNFLAYEVGKSGIALPVDRYFDRNLWFPLTSSDGLPMVEGMMAGEGSQGLPLPDAEE